MNLITAILFAASILSASSTSFVCPSTSHSNCGDKPDIHIPNNSFTSQSPAGMSPVDPAMLTRQFKRCSRELERIVYTPPNPARDYLLKIARELSSEIMSAGSGSDAQLSSLIRTLASRYNVSIEIQPNFSNRPNILFMPNMAPMMASRKFGHLIAPTYLNLVGFEYSAESKSYSVALYAPNKLTAIGKTLIVSVAADSSTFLECN